MRILARTFAVLFVIGASFALATPGWAQPLASSPTDERGLPTLAPWQG